jgi:predicted transposase YbfD/YdcC
VARASDRSVVSAFAGLPDPRQAGKVLYPLPEIMLLLVCATLAGADDFVEIEVWGGQNLGFLRRLRPFRHGIPSHDTLGEVVAMLDPAVFRDCFTAWVAGLREPWPAAAPEAAMPEVIAIDGKTSRRTHARCKGREPLHLLSAWACRQRLVLGQQAVDGKSNEITAIPRLLERLELAGALVTIDAIGTQAAIAETIRGRGGDYLLALKANRPLLLAEVERYFADPPPGEVETHRAVDADHGRIETRRHAVCHQVGWLFSDRRYPDEPRFPGLAMIGMVESETERGGRTERERRYYLCSAKLGAETFARAVRAHWGIENRLHWTLDVVFRDDLARLRTGHGPENMAVVKHFALNLLRQARPAISLKNRRKLAGWSTDYLEKLLNGSA